jgi:hypothetical protein
VWGYSSRVGSAERSGAHRVRFAVLSAREAAIVHAAALAFFPADGPIARSGVEAGCVRWFDQYLARCQPGHRRLVMLLLWFNEYGPLVFGPRRARLTRSSVAERLRFLEESARSGWYLRRVSTLTLRGLMTMAYMTDPAVLRQIGAVADLDPFGLGRRRDDALVPPPTASGRSTWPLISKKKTSAELERSRDVLRLLAHAGDLGLEHDAQLGDRGVLALGGQRVELARDFLEQEVEAAAHRLGGAEQRFELDEMAVEPRELLGDVDAIGDDGELDFEPRWVDLHIDVAQQQLDALA